MSETETISGVLRQTILIVDDDQGVQHSLRDVLEREGYAVQTAGDGQEALAAMESSFFNLILCDLMMPAMDGVAFLKELKKRGLFATVIVMSAYGSTDTALEAIKLLGRMEGVLLDPVYTGKAMAGLIADIRAGKFSADQNIVFLHTGGAAVLSAYAAQL